MFISLTSSKDDNPINPLAADSAKAIYQINTSPASTVGAAEYTSGPGYVDLEGVVGSVSSPADTFTVQPSALPAELSVSEKEGGA